MSLNTLSLNIDVTAANKDGLYLNFTDKLPATAPLFVRDDEIDVQLRFWQPATIPTQVWQDIDLSTAAVTLALGGFDALPTSGTFTLTYGSDTTSALAYNASAAAVETALNALSGIGSGGVTVTKPADGVYLVQWVNNGVRTLISGDSDGLNPTSVIIGSEVVVGSASVQSTQVVTVFQVAYAVCDSWTALPSAAAGVTVLSAGSVSTPNVQQVTLDPIPYAGTFQITTSLLTTAAIPYNATAAQVQTALNAGGDDYVVTGNVGGPWTITTTANGSVAAHTVNVSGLSVPVGLTGTLNLSTYSMLQAFITENADRITLDMEVQVIPSGGGASTVLQVPITVTKDVINLGSIIPTPLPSYYTKAECDALFAQLGATQAFTGTNTFDNVIFDGDIQALSGGDSRGSGSVDLQRFRTLSSQVASGDYSALLGGGDNTASGLASSVLGGSENSATAFCAAVIGGNNTSASGTNSASIGAVDSEANANYSLLLGGRGGETTLEGQLASGANSTTDPQTQHTISLKAITDTTDDTPSVLTLPVSGGRLTVPSGQSWLCDIWVHARSSGAAKYAAYHRSCLIENTAGTTQIRGAVSTIGTDVESDAGMDVGITADDTNDALAITVTGVAATNIRWLATIQINQITYA